MLPSAEPAPNNEWVRRIVGAAVVLLVVWCFTGWIADKGLNFVGLMVALFSGAFQFVGWNASAQMRRSPAGSKVQRFWAATMVICGAWTAYSAHHAYSIFIGEPPVVQASGFWAILASLAAWAQSAAILLVLTAWAFIEPLFGWAIEEVEASLKEPPAHSAPPAPAPAAQAEKTQTRQNPPRPKLVQAGAAIGAAALAAGAAQAAQIEQVQPAPEEPAIAAQIVKRTPARAPQAQTVTPISEPNYELARLLARQGHSAAAIVAATGVNRSTAKRYRAEVARARAA